MQRKFMRKHGIFGVATALAIGLASCSSPAPTDSDAASDTASDATTETDAAASDAADDSDDSKIDVVASYSVICDLTSEIAADAVDLNCLIAPDRDPHTYEATPSDREAVETADLVLYAGLNFEPAIIDMAAASDTEAPKIALHDESVQQLIEVEEEGELEPDPHVWHDVENGLAMVALIRDNLVAVDPDNADAYTENAEQLTAELEALDTWIPEQIATIPEAQRRLVTTLDAMSYYAEAYGLIVEGTLLGVSTEEEPTAAKVNE